MPLSCTCECVTKVIFWATTPIWVPFFCLTVPTYKWIKWTWASRIGPVCQHHPSKPLPKRRKPRRQISYDALQALQTDGSRDVEKPQMSAKNGCGFWKLPPELRMMIWKELLLLEYNGVIEVQLHKGRGRPKLYSYDPERSLDTTILQLSKQFYLEGSHILYTQNKFRLRSEQIMMSFTRQVSPSRLAQISSLAFNVYHFQQTLYPHRRGLTFNSEVWKETCADLEKFTGLKTLKIALSFDLGNIWNRCQEDEIWGSKLFDLILRPLETVQVVEGGEFIVGYTWNKGVCDSWPRGSFEMKYLEESMYWF